MRVWQRMLSGRRLDLMNPSPMDIEIDDIAHGLTRVARWNGQTNGDHGFSVAQHSVLVAQIAQKIQPRAPQSWFLAAMLDDASQYVSGDLVAPFKSMLGVDYHEFEARLMRAVCVRFGLPAILSPEMKKFIKRADKIAAYLEATQLAGFSEAEGRDLFGAPPLQVRDWVIKPVPANQSKAEYLRMFYDLAEQADADTAVA